MEKEINQSLVQQIAKLRNLINKNIIGQDNLVNSLLIALLADGHVLLEGPPGIAKTKTISTLAKYINLPFQRIQFTPDLLPSDITGSDIFNQHNYEFEFKSGPIFNNIILADEINRSPAKVQSALLEAMSEKQVSVGLNSYKLPSLFMVMATQNPIEQEGTYPLPEAQLDRFLLKIDVNYSLNDETELDIINLVIDEKDRENKNLVLEENDKISSEIITNARSDIFNVYASDSVKKYIVQLVLATRKPDFYSKKLSNLIDFGASPRASIGLHISSIANTWLDGRSFVTPEDVQSVFLKVMKHRLILSFEAQATNIKAEDILNEILKLVPIV